MGATFERGQVVYVRGEVLDTSHPEQLLVEFFSKTDQWSGWVLRDRATRGVVLDLPVEPLRIIGHLRTCADCRRGDSHWCHTLADQIEEQTKPPRIPEPQGLGAIVRNGAGLRWVRTHRDVWVSEEGIPLHWDNLIDPVLIREGVES